MPPTGASTRCAPFADALLDGLIVSLGPEVRYEQAESMSLAFVTALQILPPRQLAVLILRDVLGFHTDEVANLLDTSVEAVKSPLKRARGGMQRRLPVTTTRERPPGSDSPAPDAIAKKFASAYESADMDALAALLTDDVVLSMPPILLEYESRDSVARFFAFVFRFALTFQLVPTRANGQPASGIDQPLLSGPKVGLAGALHERGTGQRCGTHRRAR